MVGRRSALHITKRSLRNADGKSEKRPRRSVQTKVVDDTVGMSRQEEQELNKALYASLQTNRRSRSMPDLSSVSGHSFIDSTESSPVEKGRKTIRTSPKSPVFKKTRHSLGNSKPQRTVGKLGPLRSSNKISPKKILKRSGSQQLSASSSQTGRSKFISHVNSIDESSQDSARSSTSSANESKSYFDRKIHAQRKFAQGCSLPGTPVSTPAKSVNTPVKILSSRIPKTEDFLTFLCYRGTSLLPPHLDFFNFSREELPSREGGSRPSSLVRGKTKRARESTPDSSSSSGANEEVAETAGTVTPTQTKC